MRLGNKRALGSVLTTISSLFVEKDAVTPDQDFLLSADNLPHEYPGIARSAPSLKPKSYGNFEPHADYRGYKPPGHNLHEGNTALSTVMRLGLLPDGVPVWISSLLSEITPETFVLVAILHILVLFYVERIGKWILLLSSLSAFLGKFWFSFLIIIILFNYYKVFHSFSSCGILSGTTAVICYQGLLSGSVRPVCGHLEVLRPAPLPAKLRYPLGHAFYRWCCLSRRWRGPWWCRNGGWPCQLDFYAPDYHSGEGPSCLVQCNL